MKRERFMKISRKGLVKKADKAFGEFIRNRDKRCVICGTNKNLTCGHLISRVKYSVRWSEKNCHCQCRNCNYTHEYYPAIFTAWFVHQFGLEELDNLIAESNKIRKFTNEDLGEICNKYGNDGN